MTELERALVADAAAAPPSHILEALDESVALREWHGLAHTIYAELWHITFWQQMTLDWIAGVETPAPVHNSLSFPRTEQMQTEPWDQLCLRFFAGNLQAGQHAAAIETLDRLVRCPSPPGLPTRSMSIRDQLISLAAHNHYHFGRVVLMRQLAGAWPPRSGGSTW